MARYSKFIIAAIGLVLTGLDDFVGLQVGVTAEQVWTFAVPILTALGVYAIPNAKP